MAKKYPQIDPNLPIKRIWFIFALVINTIALIMTSEIHFAVEHIFDMLKGELKKAA